ncbi:MAG: hypothetical protein Q8P67_23620 [archaeon]|nr:hypothetical protein [archaeon]
MGGNPTVAVRSRLPITSARVPLANHRPRSPQPPLDTGPPLADARSAKEREQRASLADWRILGGPECTRVENCWARRPFLGERERPHERVHN